jgi:cytochrome c nitrite reductase small subunit
LRAVDDGTKPRAWPLAVAAALTGLFLGLAAFTFHYADALSYFSTDPKACANCHIMNDQYASWSKGPHHGDARCVDCHLPHELIPKYLAKASNGYHHSKGFTLQDFHEPILIKARNAEILQHNCVRCHGDFVHDALAGDGVREESRCTHCHRDVGHGARG